MINELPLIRATGRRQLEKCRRYYVKRQLAAGKTPAYRAPVVAERGAVDTLLAGILRSASGALRRLGITTISKQKGPRWMNKRDLQALESCQNDIY